MRLISVNVGERRTQPKGNGVELTGIYKMPIEGAVQLSRLGLSDDFIGDGKNHGGRDQAVFIYGQDDYDWWRQRLGTPLAPGTFGENLTIGGMQTADFNVGDRIYIGSVVLEVTAPRTPCSTLARRMGDPMFVKKYRRAERPGLYCRVIEEGQVQTGDGVSVERFAMHPVGVLEVFREHYALEKQADRLRRFLDAPIAVRVRADLEKRLRRMQEETARVGDPIVPRDPPQEQPNE